MRGTQRRWESSGVAPWDRCVVIAGELDDGRWYVERQFHPRTGPTQARAYETKANALDVARKVMDAATETLGRPFVYVEGSD